MAKVGISNLHYAIMSAEDTASANPTYGTIKKPTVGMVSVDLQVTNNKVDLYADNILWATESVFAGCDLSSDIAELPMDFQADVLGHAFDSTEKTLIKKSDDVAPYCAIGFEFLMDNGKKLCVWMYKGKFAEPQQTGQTRGENTEYQTNTITASFAGLKGAGTNKGRWQYCKEFDADASTDSFYASIPLATVTP